LIFSLGTFLGLQRSDEVLELIEAVEEFGLDAMSAGVILGWATEGYQNKLFELDECLIPLELGNKDNYLLALKHIAKRTNNFYYNLGEGSAYASSIYGGADYAMHFNGNEMSGYHTGYGSVLGSAVGARHSHLCNGGYSFDQTLKIQPEGFVEKIFIEEIDRCLLNSLIACLFARKVYDKPTIIKALGSVGLNYKEEDLDAAAKEIYKTKLRIKKLIGYDQTKIKLPKRFFETEGLGTKIDETKMYELINLFHQKNEELLNS
jgi:aldehyde:ferredoxin oxidoreductase